MTDSAAVTIRLPLTALTGVFGLLGWDGPQCETATFRYWRR